MIFIRWTSGTAVVGMNLVGTGCTYAMQIAQILTECVVVEECAECVDVTIVPFL